MLPQHQMSPMGFAPNNSVASHGQSIPSPGQSIPSPGHSIPGPGQSFPAPGQTMQWPMAQPQFVPQMQPLPQMQQPIMQQQQQQPQMVGQMVMFPNGQIAYVCNPQQAPLAQPLPRVTTFPRTDVPMPTFVVPQAEDSHTSMPDSASTSRTHPSMSTSTRPVCDTSQWGYAIVDPYHSALQRVPVPPSVVSTTRGVTAYNNDVASSSTKPCTSHVCVRFANDGACPLGDQCLNFHVSKSYIDKARGVADALCCGIHNDYFTQEMIKSECSPHMATSKFTLILDDRSEVELLPSQLAFTVGLEQLSIRGRARIINFRKQICRLHVEGKCKWTKDCGHVHLCRELHKFLTSFHFPSLVFVLSTEADPAVLGEKLSDDNFLSFLRSKSAIGLTASMISARRDAAVATLVAKGALFSRSMARTVQERFDVKVPDEQIVAPDDFADSVSCM